MGRHALTRLDADISHFRVNSPIPASPNADRYICSQFRQNSAEKWVELTQPYCGPGTRWPQATSSFEFRFLDLLHRNSVSRRYFGHIQGRRCGANPGIFWHFWEPYSCFLGITVTYNCAATDSATEKVALL